MNQVELTMESTGVAEILSFTELLELGDRIDISC